MRRVVIAAAGLTLLAAPLLGQDLNPQAASSDACSSECGFGPCFSLRAVAVNGKAIAPTNCIDAYPGDIIDTEVIVSDWAEALPMGANIFQAAIDARISAISGSDGTILPLGWDAPLDPILCNSPADCSAPWSFCQGSLCRGAHHHPETGFFIDTQRLDFVFAGLPLEPSAGLGVGYSALASYVCWANVQLDSTTAVDPGEPRYGASLRLSVSRDACGTFLYKFRSPGDNILTNYYDGFPPYPDLHSLSISVDCDCNDDGVADWETLESGLSKDCNRNGRPDDCDIAEHIATDANGDGVPDECLRKTSRLPAAIK